MIKIGHSSITANITTWQLLKLQASPANQYYVSLADYGVGTDLAPRDLLLGLQISGLDDSVARSLEIELRVSDRNEIGTDGEMLEMSYQIFPKNLYPMDGTVCTSYLIQIPFSVPLINGGEAYLFVRAKSSSDRDTHVTIGAGLYIKEWDPISEADVTQCVVDAMYGDGPISKTLTLRTTDGLLAVPGAKVWLSTTGDAANPVTAPVLTNDAGQVTYNVASGVTYYVHCEKAGYTFTAFSFTSATSTLTMDIASEIVTSLDIPLSQSFIARTLATIRRNVDEPATVAKYTDAILVGMLNEAYSHVYGELVRNSSKNVVITHHVTIAADTYTYVLPYHAQSIDCIYMTCSTGYKVFFASKSQFNPIGRLVWLEGQTLKIQAGVFSVGDILKVEYTTGGGALFCAGTVASYAADGTTITVSPTPIHGTLDTHDNAYVGSMVRVWSGATGQDGTFERVVTGYDRATRTMTLDVPLTVTEGLTLYYEIMPRIYHAMDHVVGLYMAMWISSVEGHPVRSKRIQEMYVKAMRTVRLDEFYSKLDQSSDCRSDNYDARRYRVLRNA